MLLQFSRKSVDFFCAVASDVTESDNGTPEASIAQERCLRNAGLVRCAYSAAGTGGRPRRSGGQVRPGLGITSAGEGYAKRK